MIGKRTRFVIACRILSLSTEYSYLNSVAVRRSQIVIREQQRRDVISIQLSNHPASTRQRVTKIKFDSSSSSSTETPTYLIFHISRWAASVQFDISGVYASPCLRRASTYVDTKQVPSIVNTYTVKRCDSSTTKYYYVSACKHQLIST
jgi:hypothetical protein